MLDICGIIFPLTRFVRTSKIRKLYMIPQHGASVLLDTIVSLEPGTKIAVIEFLWWAVLLAVSVEAPSLALVPFEQLDLIIGVLKFAASKAAAVSIHAPPRNGPYRFDFYPVFSEFLVEVWQELREQRDRRDVDEGQVPPGERRGPGSAPLALVHVVHDLLLLPPPAAIL